MEPRVTRRERTIYLSYELPHRVHCSRTYYNARNGSSIIVYGHHEGLRILWRGGREWKEQAPRRSARQNERTNSTLDDAMTVNIGVDEQESPRRDSAELFAVGEEEEGYEVQDLDSPFPVIVQHVDIHLGTQVLHIAAPSFSSFATHDIPTLAKTHVLLAVACSDTRVVLLSIPMAPPSPGAEQAFIENEVEVVELDGDSSIARDLAIKAIPNDFEQTHPPQNRRKADKVNTDGRLLITAVATGLNLWSVNLTANSISKSGQQLLPIMHSSLTGSNVCFQSTFRSGKFLIANRSGALWVYDRLATERSDNGASSRESGSTSQPSHEDVGQWIASYHSPFHASKDVPALARRKKILAASWVLADRGILVLLEDGEWGIWGVTASTQASRIHEDFVLRGFLGSSSAAEHVEPTKHRNVASKLAPMTPNTRKTKAQNLFTGTPKPAGVASTGGISVSLSIDRAGRVDENVILWYNGDVYSIPSMQSFWQQRTSSGGGFGSLYAPGLTHISDINLMNENITSISQFGSKANLTAPGHPNNHQDLLISAEHRLMISQQLRPPGAARQLFHKELDKRPPINDHRMLESGELDLDGMDYVLDGMADGGRIRRVGFAS